MIGGAKGIGIGIDFGIPNQYCRATSKPYIEKDVLDSLRVVVSAYGKSNNDADRSIVKNLVDASNPFIISNAAFKLNSGFGEYEQDFTDWEKSPKVTSFDSESIKFTSDVSWVLLYHPSSIGEDIPSFKVRIKLYGEGTLYYNYITQEGTYTNVAVKSEIFETPICYNTKYTGEKGVNVGFTLGVISGECSGTIEQIPSFEGAFVTDGVDDMITSTKTFKEMLVGSNECTVVSMIANLDSRQILCNSNFSNTNGYNVRNTLEPNGVISILGYTDKNGTTNNLNLIMGDKNSIKLVDKVNFNSDYVFHPSSYNAASFKTAWYWTIIANKVLTIDQINQVIAYFNLDRTLKPDILCDTIKQGITNENHAEFGDKLIDFSGNGRDIQLNNIAWKGDSGIGKYSADFESFDWAVNISQKQHNKATISLNGRLCNHTAIEVDEMKVNIIGNVTELIYWYIANPDDTTRSEIRLTSGINTLPKSYAKDDGQTYNIGFAYISGDSEITIEQIPSHAGALCLDGVNDFGKVAGMPIYKDYTFIIDREIISIGDTAGVVASKSEDSTDVNKQGAFLFEYLGAPNNISTWSFYKDNGKVANTDFTRGISYQSTYSYNGKDLTIGTSKDSDKLWLGTIRDRDSRFFNGAIYSLMSFPYSMNKFLIERQLKKHKLGTLYPNMVEFRPVIKSSVELASKPTFVIRGTSTLLNAGDYIPENSEIWVVITMNNAADRITKFVINGNTIDIPSSAYNPSTMKYGFPFTIDSKSPQKITMTIEQDENYVQWNPVVTSNVEYIKLDFYLNNYQKIINIGDYIPKDAYLRANFYLKNNVDELTVFTFNGVNIDYKRSVVDDTAFNIGAIYNYDSPQEVNITIDEYIRYEDIKQPYPVIFQIKDRNTSKIYNWGDKIKVGSSIQLIQGENPNLLSGLYSIQNYVYEGETYTYNQLKELVITITKSGIQLSCNKVWIFDDNEPKCILSPRLLNIPNSSYKILGYIPDISGHGNNGKINNSAYAEMSGANGYPYDYKSTSDFVAHASNAVLVNSEIVKFVNVLTQTSFYYKGTSYKGKIKVTGITKAIASGKVRYLDIYSNSTTNDERIIIDKDGTYDVNIETEDAVNIFFYLTPIVSGTTALDEPVYLEQVGNYEGAYCLDGVNDFVTIPTVNGGKQVFMKVNVMTTIDKILYDQRNSEEGGNFSDLFAIMTSNSDSILAYAGRNPDGKTYIDGILNTNITCGQLLNITHNITALVGDNKPLGKGGVIIGASKTPASYCKAAVYDFMLFDEISTDDKIQELNEYVGVEAKVELPPYYWDAYGRSNTEPAYDRALMLNLGKIPSNDTGNALTAKNVAYSGDSGYGGDSTIYKFSKEPISGQWSYNEDRVAFEVLDNGDSVRITQAKATTALFWNSNPIKKAWYKVNGVSTGKGIKFGSDAFNIYSVIAESDGIYEVDWSLNTNESGTKIVMCIMSNGWTGDCDITIEQVAQYPNGLALDGVDDYLINERIPALTDYTYIFKRRLLNDSVNSASMNKGLTEQQRATVIDFSNQNGNIEGYSFGNGIPVSSLRDSDIIYGTTNNVNGTSITKGSNPDSIGINISKFASYYKQMVFYKLMLYPKTISLLEINFLKNLMEKDEIIDLTNPIFIQ